MTTSELDVTQSLDTPPVFDECTIELARWDPTMTRRHASTSRVVRGRVLAVAAVVSTVAAAFFAGALLAGHQQLEWFTGDLASEAEVGQIRDMTAATASEAARAEGAAGTAAAVAQAASEAEQRGRVAGYDEGRAAGYEEGEAAGYEQGRTDGIDEAASNQRPVAASGGCGARSPLLLSYETRYGHLHPGGTMTYCIDLDQPGYHLFYASSSEADLVMTLSVSDGQRHSSDDEYGTDPALEGVYLGAGRHQLEVSGYDSNDSGAFEVLWEIAGD